MRTTLFKSVALCAIGFMFIYVGALRANESHQHQQQNVIELSGSQIETAGIKIHPVKNTGAKLVFSAPAELKANGYTSYVVSPRVESVVLKRHVSLGEHVAVNQPLVTLFSDKVAEAQAQYRIAFADWQRLKILENSTVSEKSRRDAQTQYIAAEARLIAYGLGDDSIKKLVEDNSTALGEYNLAARLSGTVLNDDFRQGQRVEAGQALMDIAEESVLWVEARIAPQVELPPLSSLAVSVDVASKQYNASLSQQSHIIDAQTRTRIIRLQLKNYGHQLHPGMFAKALFAEQVSGMFVPQKALIQSDDGDWMVFVQTEPGHFAAKEVQLKRSSGQQVEISGIEVGELVVTQGAFFIQSQMAKSGFDPHNH